MKHYAGLDLSMETTQVCIVDENVQRLVSEKVESSPEAIAMMLERYGPYRASRYRNRTHVFGDLPWTARTGPRGRVYRCPPGAPEPEGNEGEQDRSA